MRVDGTCNRALDRLLREHIDCFEKLEVLLLVRRQRDIFWTAEKVADQLGISRRSALETLEALHASNFLSTIDSAPQVIPVSARADDARTIDQLARSYAHNPIGIIRSIARNSIERIRSSAIRTFSESFRIRKDRSNGKNGR